jgi:predicted metal-dependent phosphoesterase TrpH
MKIDLHAHSHVSDGELSPEGLMRAAHTGGLDVIALTDHDTAAGIDEAAAEAAELGIKLIPGIEISTRWMEHELHILGYGIDHRVPAIVAHQEDSLLRRGRRMRGMVERLCEMGIEITFEEVIEAAGPAKSLGRPHLARALLAAGHVRYFGEAFERFISDGGPAFVAESFPTPAEAINIIHAAGGLAVWAHPPLDHFESLIAGFVEWEVDGIECFRSNLAPAETLMLLRGATGRGLLPTGGSDWHGPHRSLLGDFYVTEDQVGELVRRIG